MSFTANSSGGEYKKKLTVNELPPHSHPIKSNDNKEWVGLWKSNTSGGDSWEIYSTCNDGDQVRYAVAFEGYDQKATPFDIINPYIAVYIWKRIS